MKQFGAVWKNGCLAFLVWAGITTSANADLIYQTYTPGVDSPLMGSPVYRINPNAQQLGTRFVSSQNYLMTDATLYLQSAMGPDTFELTLREDVAGAPGNTLMLFNPGLISNPGNYTLNAIVPLPLFSGVSYWLVASPNLTADSMFFWGTVAGNENMARSLLNPATQEWGSWSPLLGNPLAYQLNGIPIPEPGGFALFLTAGMLLLILRFRRY
jgi:hypothetical protein